jgi:hypothetical protein
MAKATVEQAAKETKYDPVFDLSTAITQRFNDPKTHLVMYTACDLTQPVPVNREHWFSWVDKDGKQQKRLFWCLDGEELNGKTLTKDDCPICSLYSGKQPKKIWYIPVVADLGQGYRVYLLRLDSDKFSALVTSLVSEFVDADITQVGHKFGMYKEGKQSTARIVFAQGMINRDKLGKNDPTIEEIEQVISESNWDEKIIGFFPEAMDRLGQFDRAANSTFNNIDLAPYHSCLDRQGFVIESKAD